MSWRMSFFGWCNCVTCILIEIACANPHVFCWGFSQLRFKCSKPTCQDISAAWVPIFGWIGYGGSPPRCPWPPEVGRSWIVPSDPISAIKTPLLNHGLAGDLHISDGCFILHFSIGEGFLDMIRPLSYNIMFWWWISLRRGSQPQGPPNFQGSPFDGLNGSLDRYWSLASTGTWDRWQNRLLSLTDNLIIW